MSSKRSYTNPRAFLVSYNILNGRQISLTVAEYGTELNIKLKAQFFQYNTVAVKRSEAWSKILVLERRKTFA